jgi:glycosyltransferase involved in cell wall biosynthesis
MEIAYVFFNRRKKSAAVKNMAKTCEELGKITNLTLFTSIKFRIIKNLYGIEKNFNFNYVIKSSKGNRLKEMIERLVFCTKVFYKINQKNFDLIYTRDIFFLSFLSFMPALDSKLVFESHRPFGETSSFPSFLEIKALKQTEEIFCVSEGVYLSLKTKGIEDNKLKIQRNGVDLEKYNVSKNVMKSDETRIAYAGSFKHRKGIKTLLKAFKRIETELYQTKLILMGDHKVSDIEFNDKKNIKLTGFLPEEKLLTQYEKADILIFPSENEKFQKRYTCSMKLLEYMATNIPVIAPNQPTTKWIAGETVNYFDPGNSEDLAEEILNVIDNPEKSRKLAKKANKKVKDTLTWENKAKYIKKINKN